MFSKKMCYFKCKYEGNLYGFPPVTYTSYERFDKWKNILSKTDQRKGDDYIVNNIKLCKNHFEHYYITNTNRLTRHAVPTLNLVTPDQMSVLCILILKHPEIINDSKSNDAKTADAIWGEWGPRLNIYGSVRSRDTWVKYLCDIMRTLKTKKVELKDTTGYTPQLANPSNFTEIERTMLHIWYKAEQKNANRPGHDELYFERANYMHMSPYNDGPNEIPTVSINIQSDAHVPLLEADIVPSQRKRNHSEEEVEDEFEAFGKDIARQLRGMEAHNAREKQKLLMEVMQRKESTVINNLFLD